MVDWQEQETQELRRLYTIECKARNKLEEENAKLKEEVERLQEQLLDACKK